MVAVKVVAVKKAAAMGAAVRASIPKNRTSSLQRELVSSYYELVLNGSFKLSRDS
ncbi:hypothetical protein SAMN04488688_1177 [Paenibacillus sp. cl141a]|nr:hypothetical protein SAMN04488688_1177 [Paenibacillus sp. cl141a]